MPALSATGVGLIAGLHSYIFVLETFLWTSPRALRIFRTKPEYAAATKGMAANQGLYNSFLAAGLAWGLAHPVPAFARQIQLFFLGCVAVAGVFGGVTVNKRIAFIQTLPAALTAALVLLGL